MSNVFIALQKNEETRAIVDAIMADNPDAILNNPQHPFHIIYHDVFHMPQSLCYGVAVLPIGEATLTKELLLQALTNIRPMCLLG